MIVAIPHGAIVFSGLIGKLGELRVSCDRGGRSGRYQVQRLINDRGRDGKIVDWLDQITAECFLAVKSLISSAYGRSVERRV
jgi:hypothetical protein